MTLNARWLVNAGITTLTTNSGHTYAVSSGTCDIPASDSYGGNTFVGQAQFLTFIGATTDRPVVTSTGLTPPVSSLYDSTLARQVYYKIGTGPAIWVDQTGASV
jgi:hypothetical protein